jgi:ComF family protein
LWITTDYEGIAKELIHTYKFDHQRVAAKSIARLMADTFLSFNSDKDIVKLNYLVVPIPTASSRVRQRGFDHSVLLAQKMADRLQIPSRSVLRRVGQSRQLGAPRQIRLRQLDGSYQVHDPKLLERRNVLLVDDVLTTGGTLCAASRALRHVGASRVDALVFAKRL